MPGGLCFTGLLCLVSLAVQVGLVSLGHPGPSHPLKPTCSLASFRAQKVGEDAFVHFIPSQLKAALVCSNYSF